jgi:hypothetical protein
MDECHDSIRLPCIAIHGLHPDDTESLISLRFGQFDASAEDVAEDQLLKDPWAGRAVISTGADCNNSIVPRNAMNDITLEHQGQEVAFVFFYK